MTPSYTDGTDHGQATGGGTDFTENTDAIEFDGTAGETETFTVETTEDGLDEGDNELFTVGLTVSGTTATVTATDEATGTIIDDDGAPAMPTGLEITYNRAADGTTPASGNVTVTWDDPRPADHGSALITSYEVSAKAANLATVTKEVLWANREAGALFEASELTMGATYSMEVMATSDAGDSDPASVTATPLPEVTLSVSPATLEEADVATTATLTATLGASMSTDLVIDLSVDENADDVELSDMMLTISANQTTGEVTVTVVDDDLDEGDGTNDAPFDTVKISGTYGPDDRDAAPEDGVEITITDDDAAPTAPSPSLDGTASATQFAVEWAAVAANPAVTSYEIRWIATASTSTEDGDGAFADENTGWEVIAGGADARRRTVTGLTAETRYVVQVRAVNSVGKGARGSVVISTPAS